MEAENLQSRPPLALGLSDGGGNDDDDDFGSTNDAVHGKESEAVSSRQQDDDDDCISAPIGFGMGGTPPLEDHQSSTGSTLSMHGTSASFPVEMDHLAQDPAVNAPSPDQHHPLHMDPMVLVAGVSAIAYPVNADDDREGRLQEIIDDQDRTLRNRREEYQRQRDEIQNFTRQMARSTVVLAEPISAAQETTTQVANANEDEILSGSRQEDLESFTGGRVSQCTVAKPPRRCCILTIALLTGATVCLVFIFLLGEIRTKTAPTTSSQEPTIGSQRCFQNDAELRDAVDKYLGDGESASSSFLAVYGWPIGTWCVGNIQNFSWLFAYERNPRAINFNDDISNWDMSKATTMKNMFSGAESFSGDISNWNVSNVINMERLFYLATSFDGDISRWDVSRVTNMNGTFLSALDFNGSIADWDVSNVELFVRTFAKTRGFDGNLSTWDVSSAKSMRNMFGFTTSFKGGVSDWDVSRVEDMGWMFYEARSFNGDLSRWNVSSVVNMEYMFSLARKFRGNLAGWDVSRVAIMYRMFRTADKFDSNISGWDVSNVVNMSGMFETAHNFNHDISSWDVSNVMDMSYMFSQSSRFNQDISLWDVSNVLDFESQFASANSFDQDLCPWGMRIQSGSKLMNMFVETSCDSVDDPDLEQEVSGPFCTVCNEY